MSKHYNEPLVYRGTEFSSLKMVAETLALPYKQLRLAFLESHDLDKSIDKAAKYLEMKNNGLLYPGGTHSKPEIYDDKEYASHKKLCDEYGISNYLVYYCIRVHCHCHADFMDVFDALVRFKQRIGMSNDQMLTKLPAIIINGEPYNSVTAGLRELGLTIEQVYRYELVGLPDDKIETLKYMQTLKDAKLFYDGQVVNTRNLMRHGKEWRIQAVQNGEYKEFPRFPSLQGVDFSQGYYDTAAILKQELAGCRRQDESQVPQIKL